MLTCERRSVNGNEVGVIFGNKPVSAVVNGEDSELVDVGELFTMKFFQKEGCQLVYVHEAASRAPSEPFVFLTQLRTRHRRGKVKVSLTSAQAITTIVVYVSEWPQRPRTMMYWSFTDFYFAVDMTSFKDVPSKWAWTVEKQRRVQLVN